MKNYVSLKIFDYEKFVSWKKMGLYKNFGQKIIWAQKILVLKKCWCKKNWSQES